MTASPPVLYRMEDGVAWITLNRPAVLNAINTELVVALANAAERAAVDPEVAIVVVSGHGRAFCSGMDRTALAQGTVGEEFFRHWIRGLNCLEDMPKVSIAVLHGYSIGGGLQLALACDLRLATTDAIIGLGATLHGIIPDGAVLRLARLVGVGRAKELALLNENIAVEEARTIGLINWTCPPERLTPTLSGVIAKARRAAPTANAHTKRLLHESFQRDPRASIEDLLQAQNLCMASWETEEANRAWQEKREAVYSPRPPA